jgi:hypothetical protein
MKRNLLLAFIMMTFAAGRAQTVEMAENAPKGILVFLGKNIPNGIKAKSIKIERKEGSSGWKFLAEVKSPANEAEFLSKENDNRKYFPDIPESPLQNLKNAWKTAVSTGLLDSVGFYGKIPSSRIALGLCYYDIDVKEKVIYQYKVTFKLRDNDEEAISNIVTYPFHPKYDKVILNDYSTSKDGGLYIRWQSKGKNYPSGFKIFKYDGKTPVEITGNKGIYKKRDTTFYTIFDKTAVSGKTYQYSLVGLDKYGNTSYGSELSIINTGDILKTFFVASGARQDKKSLGVRIWWKLSDVSDIKSVHIFRSTEVDKNFKELTSVRGGDTTFTDANIKPDKVYYYYLDARDQTGKKSIKSTTFFQYGMDTRKPITPSIFAATPVKKGIKLVCNVPDKFISGIRVYRSAGNTNKFEVIRNLYETKDSGQVSFTDSSKELSGREVYSYYIISINTSHQESAKSNIVQEHPAIATEPDASPYLRVYYQDGVVNLSWKDMKLSDHLVKGYYLWKRETGTDKWLNVFGKDSVFPGSHYADVRFEEGKPYEYKVQTVDISNGLSKITPTGSVSIPVGHVSHPAGLRAVRLDEGVQLEWSPIADTAIASVKIYRYQRGQQPVSIGSTNAAVSAYLDKEAKPGELYFYSVSATDKKKRESSQSEEVGMRR